MMPLKNLDPHEKPPVFIKNIYKFYQRHSQALLLSDDRILNLSGGLHASFHSKVTEVNSISRSKLSAACGHLRDWKDQAINLSGPDIPVYEANDIPGT